MVYDSSYSTRTLVSSESLFLGLTAHEHYPISVQELDGCLIVLEGRIYNKSDGDLGAALRDLAVRVATEGDVCEWAREFASTSDGEYVLLIVDPCRRFLWVLNDALGRLPLYAHRGDRRFILSREVKFPVRLMSSMRFDRQGIAESLFFGYTLGPRTLVEGVRRLPFGTLLKLDLASAGATESRVFSFCYEESLHRGKPLRQMAGELKERFVNACHNLDRAFRPRPQVVSLSGGLDSRSVLAGLLRAGCRPSAVTFQDAGMPGAGSDAVNAEKAAAALGVDWRLVDIHTPSRERVDELLMKKDGMNYVGMAFIIPFFEEVKRLFGRDVIYYTGDVGDRTMEPQGPPTVIRGLDDLLNKVLARHRCLPVEQAAAIAGIRTECFRDAVRGRLEEYPEQDMNCRYTHFIMAERLGSWNWEAEDRNRYWFWPATPFAALSVYRYAMNVPMEAKRLHRLYEAFLSQLCPECIHVPNTNWGAPLASWQRYVLPMLHSLFGRLPPSVRCALKDWILYRNYSIRPENLAFLKECFQDYPLVPEYLAEDEVRRVLHRGCNPYNFDNLLTIAGYIRIQHEASRHPRAVRATQSNLVCGGAPS
jgi:asparagine synthase (glutamine-hydrolysing)